MNREAVALGMPVYTTFGGRLGGVDEQLIREAGSCGSSEPPISTSTRSPAPASATTRPDSCSTSCSAERREHSSP